MPIPLSGKPGRPSIELKKYELKSIQSLFTKHQTFTEVARLFNMDRVSFTRIVKKGAGSPANIKKIRRRLSRLKSAA